MYLYYDRNNVLKEVINDEAIVATNTSTNIYIYYERQGNNVVGSAEAFFRLSNGEFIEALDDGEDITTVLLPENPTPENVPNAYVPYNPDRDLKFFKYGQAYPFTVIHLGTENLMRVLSEDGVVAGTPTLTIAGQAYTLELFTFMVEASAVEPEESLTASQFAYLVNLFEKKNIIAVVNIGDTPYDYQDNSLVFDLTTKEVWRINDNNKTLFIDLKLVEDDITLFESIKNYIVLTINDQTIGGTKTFSQLAYMTSDIGSGANEYAITNKKYVDAHINDKYNPHEVTKVQVGLGNVDNVQQIPLSEKGQANGVATLDNTGKIPTSQIPESVLGQVEYQGSWNASSNTSQTIGTPKKGDYYICQTKGRYNPDGTDSGTANYYEVGDWAIIESINPIVWEKIDNTDSVVSVNGKQGTVVLTKGDIGLGNVDNTSDDTKKSNFTGSIVDGNTGFVTGGDVYDALENKQDSLTAGSNVSISAQNVISATDTTYSAGTGLTLNDTTFAIDDTVVATETDIAPLINGASFSVSGDNANLTFTKKGSSESDIAVNIPLANINDAGLMSSSDVNAIATLNGKVSALEGIVHRLLYTASSNPTANDILTFVQNNGYTDVTTYYGIKVVVSATNHTWIWYENIGEFQDIGIETIEEFTNSVAGSILGSTDLGKVYAESDGTGSLNGYDKLNNNVAPQYSSSSTYSVGDLVIYQGDLYKCTTDISTAESWDSTHWTQTTIDDQIDTKSSVSALSYNANNTALTGLTINGSNYKLVPFIENLNGLGIGKTISTVNTSGTSLGYNSLANASGSIALGYASASYINNAFSFDSTSTSRYLHIRGPEYIFFRNDANNSSYTSLADYTSGYKLNERLNGLTNTNDSIRELDYDKISVIGLTANATFTLKTAPSSTGSGFSCKPTYRVILTNNSLSSVTARFNTTTGLTTNDASLNYTVYSNYTIFTLLPLATYEINIFNGIVRVINPTLSASKLSLTKNNGSATNTNTYGPESTSDKTINIDDYGARYHLGRYDTIDLNSHTITRKTGYVYLKNCTVEKISANRFQVFPKLTASKSYSDSTVPNMIISRVFTATTPINVATNNSENICTINSDRWLLFYVSAAYYSNNTAESFLNDYGDIFIQYELETAYTDTINIRQPLDTLDLNGSQWVRKLWEDGLNLFNPNTSDLLTNYAILSDGTLHSNYQDFTSMSAYMSVKPNTTYYIYADCDEVVGYLYSADYESNFTRWVEGTTPINKFSFTTNANDHFIRFRFYKLNGSIMFVEGGYPYSYVPYNTPTNLLKSQFSKTVNLCNVGWSHGSYNGQTGAWQPNTPNGFYGSAGHIKVCPNTTYTLYSVFPNTTLYIFYYDKSGTFRGYLEHQNIRTFTTPSDVYEIAFNIGASGQPLGGVMLYEGEKYQPYVPCDDDILLWNNFNPWTSFDRYETNIPISNINSFKYLVVVLQRGTSSPNIGREVYKVQSISGAVSTLSMAIDTAIYIRNFQIVDNTTINFGNAYTTGGAGNKWQLIPVAVYGTNHL